MFLYYDTYERKFLPFRALKRPFGDFLKIPLKYMVKSGYRIRSKTKERRKVMKFLKNLISRYGGAISAFALMITVYMDGTCRFILNQPEEPKELSKLRKS